MDDDVCKYKVMEYEDGCATIQHNNLPFYNANGVFIIIKLKIFSLHKHKANEQ